MNFDGDAIYVHTAECDEALAFLRDEAERLQLENIALGNTLDAIRGHVNAATTVHGRLALRDELTRLLAPKDDPR